ncbi:MAG: hypothetical protein K9W44_04145 [Candidatus Lokiarchaeota archaeon]|nr:hypothetical protein [Candidatus Harpocratesius repetitus]
MHLDKADRSILIATRNNKRIILSDDGGLILETYAQKLKAYLFPQFLLNLVKHLKKKTTGKRYYNGYDIIF